MRDVRAAPAEEHHAVPVIGQQLAVRIGGDFLAAADPVVVVDDEELHPARPW